MRNRQYLNEFAKLMAQRRGARRWSQQSLAVQAGTTQSTISAIEQGKANPTIDTMADIATALGCGLEIRLTDRRPGKD